jgi:uncharacterized protein
VTTQVEIKFNPIEIRVLACLIEKESTTPEAYPLTLNSLTRAANQLSNREPVMELSEMDVQDALDSLAKQMLVSTRSGSDSRVTKFAHRLRERRTPEFDFAQAELAVIAVLLLRGAQTLGEIRTRTARIYQFEDMQTVIDTLQKLAERSDGPYVAQLPRQPGQKEARYMHLFAGSVGDSIQTETLSQARVANSEQAEARAGLEQRVQKLEEELASLQEKFSTFVKQFE